MIVVLAEGDHPTQRTITDRDAAFEMILAQARSRLVVEMPTRLTIRNTFTFFDTDSETCRLMCVE